MSTGYGQRCPIDPGHGPMMLGAWDGQWCASNVHGGNGRFFGEDVAGYTLDEEEVLEAYAGAARAIIQGRRDLEEATRSLAKSTGARTEIVRDRLRTMIEVVKHDDEEQKEQYTMARAKGKEAAAAEAAEAKASKGERAPRVLKEHVAPERFAALRDELGFSNTEAASATGKSASRMTEFTKTKGGSVDMFEAYEHDLRAWREEHPEPVRARRAKAADTAEGETESAETDGETSEEG